MASIKRIDIVKSNILEEKLKLLHNCMEFGETPPVLVDSLAEYKAEYEAFLETVKDIKIIDTERKYIIALTELRKALLGS